MSHSKNMIILKNAIYFNHGVFLPSCELHPLVWRRIQIELLVPNLIDNNCDRTALTNLFLLTRSLISFIGRSFF
uniref:Putative ovule protein n=1 Tax=Solanum chacoense TaxID=4108 RepID=A0A0V0HQI3_SOLCH